MENNESLNMLLTKASDYCIKHSCKLLINGDFNYKTINWETYTTNSNDNSVNSFIEAVLDNDLFQLIHENTRFRGDDIPSCIDLLFTNDDSCVTNVHSENPIGKSDHVIIVYNVRTPHDNN